MSSKKKYVLTANEIEMLTTAVNNFGPEKTYENMWSKAAEDIEKIPDVDEILMDMADQLLLVARNHIVETDKEKEQQQAYYTLSAIMRKMGHKVNRIYIERDKKVASERYIRLVK